MFPFAAAMYGTGGGGGEPGRTRGDVELGGLGADPVRTFTAGGLEYSATLAKMRRLRRTCECLATVLAVFVTGLVCAFRVTTRAAAYAILLYTGLFFEFLRRGSLAVAARELKRDTPSGFDAVCEELRSAYSFAWLSAVWLCWIAGNELLLSTGALSDGEPFGETIGTVAGLLHLSFALLVSWPGMSEQTSFGLASELAFPALLASALLVPTSKSALQHGGIMLAITRTGGAFFSLFALQTRLDMVFLPETTGPNQGAVSYVSPHARQLRAAKLVVQSAWLLLVPGPFMFAIVLVLLLNEKQQRKALFRPAARAPQRPASERSPRRVERRVEEGKKRQGKQRENASILQNKKEAKKILQAVQKAGGEGRVKSRAARGVTSSQDLLRALHVVERFARKGGGGEDDDDDDGASSDEETSDDSSESM